MNNIIKELEKVLHMGFRPDEVFNHWLDLMIYSLSKEEEKYMSIVEIYRNDVYEIGKRPIDYFAKAFGLLMREMKATNDDLLGQIYMQWNVNNKYTRQYFTPPPIAKMMAEITNPIKGRISDPCCGSGIMLIEACKTISAVNLYDTFFVGQDIDLTCTKMCALNLCFFNLHGYVIHGNSLTVEYNRVYQTKRSVWGGSIRQLPEKDLEEFRKAVNDLKQSKDNSQLSFFQSKE